MRWRAPLLLTLLLAAGPSACTLLNGLDYLKDGASAPVALVEAGAALEASTVDGNPEGGGPAETLTVAANYGACAVTRSGDVFCWGDGAILPDPEFLPRDDAGKPYAATPKRINVGEAARSVGVSWGAACAATASGKVVCWGLASYGQLARGPGFDFASQRPGPALTQATAPLEGATAVAGGAHHLCALAGVATLCWGLNNYYEMGLPLLDSYAFATATNLGAGKALATGADFTCILTAPGALRCVGSNNEGQLAGPIAKAGDPSEKFFARPLVGVSAGEHHGCAVDDANTLHCWGRNTAGQAGGGASPAPPQEVTLPDPVRNVAAGRDFTCATLTSGKVACFGVNDAGQRGLPPGTAPSAANLVAGVESAVGVTAGQNFACARLADGAVHCWGGNDVGQLGDGTTVSRHTPRPVLAPDG